MFKQQSGFELLNVLGKSESFDNPNRDIAAYMDKLAKKTGIARLVGSGGGVLAGGLTVAGGVMTVLTAGAAMPVLAAGAGLGLASGITGE